MKRVNQGGKPLRLLFVDSLEDDASLIVDKLRRAGHEPVYQRVDTAEAMSAALDDGGWDAVLADREMSGFSPSAALALLRQKDLGIPLILTSEAWRDETPLDVLRPGDQDFIPRENLARLTTAIECGIARAEVRQVMRHAEEGSAVRVHLAGLVAEVIAELSQRETLRDGLQRTAEILALKIDAAFARIWVLNETEKMLELKASAGIYTHTNGAHGRVPLGKFKIGRIADTAQPHLTNEVMTDSWVGDKEWARRERMIAFAGYPLVVQGRVLGVVAAFARHRFSDSVVQAFAAVANVIAAFIVRKRSEESLRLRTRALEATANGIVITDANGRILWLNNAFTTLTGYGPAEVLGKTPRILKSGKQDKSLYENLWHTILSGKVWHGELINRRKDATFYTEEQTITPVTGDNGEITHFIAVKQDITERKKTESALMRSEAYLAAGQRLSHTGSWAWDMASDELYWSQETFRIFGFNPAKVKASIHDTFLSRIHPEDLSGIQAGLNCANCPKEPIEHVNYRIVLPDGSIRHIHDVVHYVTNSDGEVVERYGVSIDVTERIYAEEAFRRSESKFRRLADANIIGIVQADFEGHVLDANERFLKLLGYTTEELQAGKVRYDRLTPAGRLDELNDVVRQLRTSGVSKPWDTEVFRKDGSRIPVLIGLAMLEANEEQAIGYMLDLTQQKHAQAATLGAKKAAEDANRVKSEFLANMSHEIRTPINGVLGLTELMLDTELTREQREYMGMIKSSGDLLLTVINGILDFSRIEAGKIALDLIEFNLRDCLEETTSAFAVRAHQKGLELVCNVPHGLPESIVGDPTRLRQILVNLLGNAVKFTDRGDVTLRVDVEEQEADSVLLHFVVRDTGIGIPVTKQAIVFQAFTQADGSVTRKFGGTGLGLSISGGLVKLMGGRVWVESKEGEGSQFHFTARVRAVPRKEPIKPAADSTLVGLPVLIVDDNAMNRRFLGDVLAQWGMNPTSVDDAASALDVLHNSSKLGRPFPLVLTDCHMPVNDGFSLAKHIKCTPEFAGAIIMMLSSGGQHGDAARCRELGVAAYLTKPIRQLELRKAILEALGQQGNSRKSTEIGNLITKHSLREGRRRLHILVAEDNLVNQHLAVRLLEKQGHVVSKANNGMEVLAAIETQHFDLILMDVQMPKMGGIEATAAIRKREKVTGIHLPIVALTAHAMKTDHERCLAAGMDSYISKPIDGRALFETIETIIKVQA